MATEIDYRLMNEMAAKITKEDGLFAALIEISLAVKGRYRAYLTVWIKLIKLRLVG